MKSDLLQWAVLLKRTLKIIPMLMAFFCILNSILSYLDINVTWVNYISGVSLLPMIFLYIASYAFKFCEYHRMFLHYIVFINLINFTDAYIGIPLSDVGFLYLSLIITGIFLFVILRLKFKS